MITMVTITGADDSIKPEELLKLSDKYPFVEWAILLSKNSQGKNRFPSMKWIERLMELNNDRILSGTKHIQLSGHLCGQYVKDLLNAKEGCLEDLDDVLNMFERIQINTHGQLHMFNTAFTEMLNEQNQEFIFQGDNVNDQIYRIANKRGVKMSVLFDCSHGAGILPEEWPEPLEYIKSGYAGGISPDNIQETIHQICELTQDVPTWIDMETHVRSNNDQQFDLQKVEQCLEIAAPYIYKR